MLQSSRAPKRFTTFERTEIGRAAEEIVAKGDLLPDELMLRVVSSKLDALRNKVCCVIVIQHGWL
jgi:adenylate kinase family enzyme